MYVDASVPPGDEITPGLDAGADATSSDAAPLADTGTGGDDSGDDSGDDGGGMSPTTYEQVILNGNPVAYWRLDETTGPKAKSLDSPNFNAAYLDDVELGVPGAIAGESDTAIHLSGDTGAVVLAGGFAFFGPRPFTLELWMRPTVAASATFSFLIKVVAPAAAVQIVYQQAGGAGLHGVESIGGVPTYANASTDPVVAAWSYVVLESDGTKLQLFLNDRQVAVSPLANLGADAGDAGDAGASFSIGGDENGYSSFTGDIDEVAVYSRQLSTVEILRHYSVGTGHDAGM